VVVVGVDAVVVVDVLTGGVVVVVVVVDVLVAGGVADALIGPNGFEVATAEPFLFVAVTATRTVPPTLVGE
jgi:hypothetical protein